MIPGAWMGKWAWKDLKENLEGLNHKVHSMTLSGLNAEDSDKDFGLQDHVNDLKLFIENRDLTDVIVVGHSYSGLVIGQLADQIPERISKLIFVEAFLPINGENLFQAAGLDPKEENKAINDNGGKWPPPKLEELRRQSHMTSDEVEYLNKNLIDHPAKSVREKASIKSDRIGIPSTFVGAELNLSDAQKALYDKLDFRELNGGHWPMLSESDKLTKILDEIATAE